MSAEELYKEYGHAMIQAELCRAKATAIKKELIANPNSEKDLKEVEELYKQCGYAIVQAELWMAKAMAIKKEMVKKLNFEKNLKEKEKEDAD